MKKLMLLISLLLSIYSFSFEGEFEIGKGEDFSMGHKYSHKNHIYLREDDIRNLTYKLEDIYFSTKIVNKLKFYNRFIDDIDDYKKKYNESKEFYRLHKKEFDEIYNKKSESNTLVHKSIYSRNNSADYMTIGGEEVISKEKYDAILKIIDLNFENISSEDDQYKYNFVRLLDKEVEKMTHNEKLLEIIKYNEENQKLIMKLPEEIRKNYYNKNEENEYKNIYNNLTVEQKEIVDKIKNNNDEISNIFSFNYNGINHISKLFNTLKDYSFPEKEILELILKVGSNEIYNEGINKVFGNKSVVTGFGNTVVKSDSYVYGTNNDIKGRNNRVIGKNNTVDSDNNILLGDNIKIDKNISNAIVIGDNSEAVSNAISIGAKGKERKIVNVSNGEVSENSKEVINGSQLYEFSKKIGRNTN